MKQKDQTRRRSSRIRSSTSTQIHFTPLPEIDNVDALDVFDPKYAAAHVCEIFDNFKRIETKYLPSPNYMEKQSHITTTMRAVMINWLAETHTKFELLPQTLYLTVDIVDRFLDRKIIYPFELRLVCGAAMLLASKYEETKSPLECLDLVEASDDAFSVDDLIEMEAMILNVLEFRLTAPSRYTFLRRFLKIMKSTFETQHLATYLIERSLQEYELLKFKPSMIAASALITAQAITENKTWTPTIASHSGYSAEDLQECALTLKRVYHETDVNRKYLRAVRNKYSSVKYMRVATIPLNRERHSSRIRKMKKFEK